MSNLKPAAKLQAGSYVKKVLGELSALSVAGKLEEAESKARELHRQYPDRADVNDALSLALVDQKKQGAALPFAEYAAKAEPKNSAYLVNLGRLYMELEVIEDALPVLERAMACKPAPFQAPWAIAEFFHETGKAERAIPYFEKALATADKSSFMQIQQDLLQSLSSLGRVAQAESVASNMAPHRGFNAIATVRKASLHKYKIDSPIFEELQSLKSEESMGPERKAMVSLEIGRIYENSKKYDEAFDCFANSKVDRKWNGDLEAFAEEAAAHIAAFNPEAFSKYAAFGNPSEQPVFVVGMPRSGTTLTEQIIGAHPHAGGVGELKRIRRLYSGFAREAHPEDLFDVFKRVGPGKWRDVPNLYLRLINYLSPGKKRIVDKMPHNFVMVGFIALCFPNARIVHTRRNPMDNFISAYQNHMSDFHGYSFDQITYAKYYQHYERLMAHWNAVLPGRIFDLNYDELVQEPEPIVRKLVDFIGLEWSDECLKFHEKETTVRTFSKHQVRSAVNANSLQRWRNYEKHLGPMLEILGVQ